MKLRKAVRYAQPSKSVHCNVRCGSKTEVSGLARHVRFTLRCRHRQPAPACPFGANNGLLRRNEGKRPALGLLRSSEQNWTSIIWERGHTGIMASERKVLARQEFSCTSRAR